VPDPAPDRTTGTDGDDVETAKSASLAPRRQEITCCVHNVSQFHVVNGFDGIHQSPLLPRPHLHENYCASLAGHNVDLSQGAQEVPFEDTVAAEQEIERCRALTAFSGEDVGGFALEEHVGGRCKGRAKGYVDLATMRRSDGPSKPLGD